MDPEPRAAILSLMGAEPLFIDAGDVSACARPRIYWISIPATTPSPAEVSPASVLEARSHARRRVGRTRSGGPGAGPPGAQAPSGVRWPDLTGPRTFRGLRPSGMRTRPRPGSARPAAASPAADPLSQLARRSELMHRHPSRVLAVCDLAFAPGPLPDSLPDCILALAKLSASALRRHWEASLGLRRSEHSRTTFSLLGRLPSPLVLECLEESHFCVSDVVRRGLADGRLGPHRRGLHCAVRSRTFLRHELLGQASQLGSLLVAGQSALAARASPEDLFEIYSQTLEYISRGRTTPLTLASSRSSGLVARRVGVRQLPSVGKSKLRCIDDFAESLVNSTTSVSRRICMDSVEDLAESHTLCENLGPRPTYSLAILRRSRA